MNDEDVEQAVKKNNEHMGQRYIEGEIRVITTKIFFLYSVFET